MATASKKRPSATDPRELSALVAGRLGLHEVVQSRQRQRQSDSLALENDWRAWLTTLFPRTMTAPFAAHHARFWQWVWALEEGVPSDPLVLILPRGGGKSSSAEPANIAVGARGTRRYGLYVSATQEQADKHLNDIGIKLESSEVARYYPAMGQRSLGLYGRTHGWRRNRLSTASGFVIDALGLEVAARGLKFGDQRPDLLTLDDIDALHDSEATRQKKIETLTQSVLPAMAPDAAVLAVQNLISADSIFAQLADGRADFLRGRTVIGPLPAAYDLDVELDTSSEPARYRVTGGTPTWAGQDLAVIAHQINQWSLGAFLREAQHEVTRDPEDALWRRAWIAAARVPAESVSTHDLRAPVQLARAVVGVDPSGSKRGDVVGIVTAGLGYDGHGYVIADDSGHASPDEWATAAVLAWQRARADRIVAEANFGGEMVASIIRTAAAKLGLVVPVTLVHASRGKAVRADPVAALYQQGRVHHAGTFADLENELCRWRPIDPESPGRLDAAVWVLSHLLLASGDVGALDADVAMALAEFTGLG